MTRLADIRFSPDLHQPVLVCALEGWIDAGLGAANAMSVILTAADAETVAVFDADRLLDHRARRPIMHLVNGVITGLSHPSVELRAGTDGAGNDLLLLVGAEPDFRWNAFCAEVVALAEEFGVRQVVTLGAYPAPVPHTRPVQLAVTSGSPEVASSMTGFVRGSLDVPGGVHALIDVACNEAGIPAAGLWAQVPHYASGMPYPAASVALVEGLAEVAGLQIDPGQLVGDRTATARRLEELIAANREHRVLVEQLEELYDETVDDGGPLGSGSPEALLGIGPLPSGDDIAEELQRFLEHNDED